MLVPPEFMDNLLRKEQLQTDPHISMQVSLDKEMENILQSKLPEYEKMKLYNQTLQKFLHFAGTASTEPPPPPPQAEQTTTNDGIVGPIPDQTKPRAKTIEEFLQAHKDAISWNERGEVSLHGRKIHGSHITDLLAYLVQRKATNNAPLGFDEFLTALAGLLFPTMLAGNAKLKRQIESVRKAVKRSEDDDDDGAFSTPYVSRGSKKRKRKLRIQASAAAEGPVWYPLDEDI